MMIALYVTRYCCGLFSTYIACVEYIGPFSAESKVRGEPPQLSDSGRVLASRQLIPEGASQRSTGLDLVVSETFALVWPSDRHGRIEYRTAGTIFRQPMI